MAKTKTDADTAADAAAEGGTDAATETLAASDAAVVPEAAGEGAAAGDTNAASAATLPGAAATPPIDDGKAAYEVLHRLDHDLKPYAPGETVWLTEKQAEPLLAYAVQAKA